MNSNKLAMTVEEAAEYTGIGRNTMRQLIEEWKAMPVLKVGRKILIPTDVLIKFISLNQNVNLRDKSEIHKIS